MARIGGNVGWLFVDKISRAGAAFIVGVWIARYFGPEQYGIFNYATAIVALFGTISGLGLNSVVVRDLVQEKFEQEETLGSACFLQFLAGALVYIAILVHSIIFWNDASITNILILILGLSILFKGADISQYWFESQVQSRYVVLVQNAIFVLFVVVKISLILLKTTLLGLAWVTAAEAFVTSAALISVFSLYGINFSRLKVRYSRAITLLKDAWPLLFAGIMVTIYMKIDLIMLQKMSDAKSLGIYSAAARMSEVWYLIPMAIVASVTPSIIKEKNKNELLYYNKIQKLFDLMGFVSIFVSILVFFFSTQIANFLFGEEYEGSGIVLAIHIWSSVFVYFGVAAHPWFVTEGRQMQALHRTFAGAGVNICLNFILIPKFGALGAAVATVIACAVSDLFYDFFCIGTRRIFYMKVKALNPFRIMSDALVFIRTSNGNRGL